MISRRRLLQGLAGLGLGGMATGVYAGVIEPGLRLRTKSWSIRPPMWPRSRSLRIVVLSDLHEGEPYMPLSRVERVVDQANALDADLVVLLGDYRASHALTFGHAAPHRVARALARLRARSGVHAILGNHDWWDDFGEQRERRGRCWWWDILEEAGLAVLHNRAVFVETRSGPLWLAGLGDQLAYLPIWRAGQRRLLPAGGLDDLPAIMATIPDDGAPAILLAHEPDVFVRTPERFALTLAGHTHGGQVRLFGWSPRVPSAYGNRFAYGHVREGRRDLVISGGLGCSVLPVRLGVPPEITVVDLS